MKKHCAQVIVCKILDLQIYAAVVVFQQPTICPLKYGKETAEISWELLMAKGFVRAFELQNSCHYCCKIPFAKELMKANRWMASDACLSATEVKWKRKKISSFMNGSA